MSKTKNTIALLAALLVVGVSGRTAAGFVGFPKALTTAPEIPETQAILEPEKPRTLLCGENFEYCQPRKIALFSMPKALKPQLDQVQLGSLTLPPMAHSVFCVHNPEDCRVRRIAFRGRPIELTQERWKELVAVNAQVNRSIRPERNTLGLAGEKWLIRPVAGDCNDYAVTKRNELLARGWPSRSLLLAEVATRWGEHHLILVVRTGTGDYILDNMNANIRLWSKAPYRWVRMQSPRNPLWWTKVQQTNA